MKLATLILGSLPWALSRSIRAAPSARRHGQLISNAKSPAPEIAVASSSDSHVYVKYPCRGCHYDHQGRHRNDLLLVSVDINYDFDGPYLAINDNHVPLPQSTWDQCVSFSVKLQSLSRSGGPNPFYTTAEVAFEDFPDDEDDDYDGGFGSPGQNYTVSLSILRPWGARTGDPNPKVGIKYELGEYHGRLLNVTLSEKVPTTTSRYPGRHSALPSRPVYCRYISKSQPMCVWPPAQTGWIVMGKICVALLCVLAALAISAAIYYLRRWLAGRRNGAIRLDGDLQTHVPAYSDTEAEPAQQETRERE